MNYLNELKKLEILHVDNYQYIEIKKLNKDEYLLHQGEKLNYIYILLRGKVKVNHINANGNSMLCSFNSPYSIIGDLELDETLTSRDIINSRMRSILDEATDPWGIKVHRVEVKNIIPPRDIQEAMEKQMRAERERREAILQAEGKKTAAP